MRDIAKILVTLGAALFVCWALISRGIEAAGPGLSAALLLLLALAFMAGMALFAIVRRLDAWQPQPREPRAIDASYTYREPLPALLPRRVLVPTLKRGGQPAPFGLEVPLPDRAPEPEPAKAPTTLAMRDDAGDEVTISLELARRFAALPGPSRADWRGNPTSYGQAARVFALAGMLDPRPGGGWTWRPGYDEHARLAWLAQFEGVAA